MLGSLALAIAVVLGSPQVDTAVVGRAEVQVGSAPPRPREPSEAAMVMTATPGVAARVRDRRWTLILEAAPRIYYRVPNLLDLNRPLYLAWTRDSLVYQMSRRLAWLSHLDGTYGEVDYSSQQIVFGPIPRQVDQAVTKVLAVRADTGLRWDITHRYSLGLTGYVLRTGPIGDTPQSFPATTSLRLRLQPRYQLDRLSSVDLDVSPAIYFVDPGDNYANLSTTAGYERELSRRTGVRVAAGATTSKPSDGPLAVSPLVVLTLNHTSYQRRGVRVINRFLASLDAPLDPTTGRVTPAASVSAAASGQIAETWFIDAAGYATTLVSRRPVIEDSADTTIFANASVRKELVQGVHVSVGSRYLTRGTHLNAPKLHLFDREIWGFVALTIALSPDSNETPAAWAL